MAPTSTFALALFALASSVFAQSTITSRATTASVSGSVVAFTFPGGLDNGTYVGSLIGTANSLTTLLVGCVEGTNTEECDFYPPIPITANSNTIRATWIYGTTFSYTYGCTMSVSGATCTAEATGEEADFVTQTTGTASLTQITSSSFTQVYNATDIITADITVVTGNATGKIAGLGSTVVTTSSSNGTAVSTSTSTSHSSSSGASSVTTFHPSASLSSAQASTAASSTSASKAAAADVKILAPGFFAAGLVGLAAVLL